MSDRSTKADAAKLEEAERDTTKAGGDVQGPLGLCCRFLDPKVCVIEKMAPKLTRHFKAELNSIEVRTFVKAGFCFVRLYTPVFL